MRILSIILTTIGCALFFGLLFGTLTDSAELGWLTVFAGGFFGFWFSYTGRLARMFRKV